MQDTVRVETLRSGRRTMAVGAGTLAVILGDVIDIVDFSRMRMSGMGGTMVGVGGMDGTMWLGILCILLGLGAVVWGLGVASMLHTPVGSTRAWRVRSLDTSPLMLRHLGLAAILIVAVVIDVMKPATLAFVVPGAAAEYHLLPRFVALWWPLSALSGTLVGSLIWGWLADRCGRRPSLYLATLFFVATAMCGTMPSFSWNLLVCFLMGASAGGMLPLVFTLMAELLPTAHRGWLSVLVGGTGTVGGYLAASGAAYLLEPIFGWRVLWLIGLPTGLLLLLLITYIPESPRHLLQHGRREEARAILRRFRARLEEVHDTGEGSGRRVRDLRWQYAHRLGGLGLYGLGWGLVNFGFLTWLPTILRGMGVSGEQTNLLLSRSAIVAVPGVALMVWFYARGRTNLALATGALGIAAVLVAIGFLEPRAGIASRLLIPSLGFLLAMLGGSSAALAVYSAEVFPTDVRATSAGLIAGCTKLGGVLGPPIVALLFSLRPGLLAPAWVLAAPLAAAGLFLWLSGTQTGGLPLEDISA